MKLKRHKKVSNRKQVARQLSCKKNFTCARDVDETENKFSSHLVWSCKIRFSYRVRACRRSRKFWGTLQGPRTLGWGHGWTI